MRLARWIIGATASVVVIVGSLFAVVASALAATPQQLQEGQWGAVFNLGVAATHQVLMHNGKVLLWRAGDEAKVWDPENPGRLADTPEPFPMAEANFHCGAHVVLADGRVLVLGGGDTPHFGHNVSAVFDPTTQTWTRMANMTSARWYPTATVLSDGRVLAANGEDSTGLKTDVSTVELYDPAANAWTVLPGADRAQPIYSANYLLPDGRLYEAAPRKTTGFLNFATNRWTPGPVSGWTTNSYSESGAMYRPGKIIRSGGTPSELAATDAATPKTGVIDLTSSSPRWEETTSMAFPRRRHNMVIMADGQVMAVGGTRQGQDVDQSVYEGEIWNPDTKRWTTVARMAQPRAYHSAALLLPDGRILSAGGEPGDYNRGGWDSSYARTAQIYSPPYMFKDRPTISAASGTAGYGKPISINTIDADSIDSVALIRAGSATHAMNFEQRYVPLAFHKGSGQLTATGPANGNVAPPGWYMLVINKAGVPSVAKWIQIGDGLATGTVPPPTAPPARVPPPESVSPGSDAPPATGGQQPSTGGSALPPGDTGGGRTRVSASTTETGAITALKAPSRISARSARRRGLAIRTRISEWGDAHSRTLIARLYRVGRNGRRQPVLTVSRTVAAPGPTSFTLPARRLRNILRAGRYAIQMTVGERGGARSPAVKRTIVVVR
jgi:galactose oxidase-like protein/Kelch motif protein